MELIFKNNNNKLQKHLSLFILVNYIIIITKHFNARNKKLKKCRFNKRKYYMILLKIN